MKKQSPYLIRRVVLFLALMFSFIGSTFAETALTFDIPEDPNKSLVTVLDNGLQVAVKYNPFSEMVSCQLWVRAGSLTEGEFMGSGISHYLEHLLFKGTQKRGVGAIAQEVENLGGDINAYTSFDRTVYTIDLPSAYLKQAVDILADVSINAVLDPAEFEKEKKVILQELSFSEDDPEKKIARLLWQNAFKVHPYQYPVIGYKEIFEKITREQVQAYYRRYYVPNNMLLVISGHMMPFQAVALAKEYFGSMERKSVPPVLIPEEPPQIGPRYLIVEKDLKKAYFYLAFQGPRVTSPHVAPLDVLSVILGEGQSSRLYRTLREEKKLAYSVESWCYTPKEPGLFAISATLAPENIESLKKAMWDEIKNIQANGVSQEEAQKAKASLLKDILGAKETARGEANTIGSNLFTAEDSEYTQHYLKQVMGVTLEQVQEVANSYFSLEKEIVTILKPYDQSSSPAEVVQNQSPSEVIKRVLPNGMTLLVRSIPGLPFVSIKALCKGGVLTETEKNNGVSYLLTQMFLKGSQELPRQEFMNELEQYGGELTTYTGYNSFGCQMSLLSPFWREGVRLMHEAVRWPNFNQNDLEAEKVIMLAGIHAKEDEPFDAAGKYLRESLFVKHPYRMQPQGALESVPLLKLKDVESYFNNYVDPKNMVFVVVGGVDSKEVEEFISTLFASFESMGKLDFPQRNEDPQKEVRKLVKEKETNQAVIALGFHGVSLFDKDQYALEIIAAIYSGQGSRLFKSVREEKGLAYTVGAYQMLGLDPGFFTFYAGTRPDKGDEVVEIILNEIELLKKEGITQEELIRAQNGLIGDRQKEMESSSKFAFKIGLDEVYGLGFDHYQNYEKEIRSVSLEDVIHVARKYFNKDEYSLVVVKPK